MPFTLTCLALYAARDALPRTRKHCPGRSRTRRKRLHIELARCTNILDVKAVATTSETGFSRERVRFSPKPVSVLPRQPAHGAPHRLDPPLEIRADIDELYRNMK